MGYLNGYLCQYATLVSVSGRLFPLSVVVSSILLPCFPCVHVQSFGAIGSRSESPADVEGVAGISITLASLPGVEVSVTHTLRSGIPDEGELGPPIHLCHASRSTCDCTVAILVMWPNSQPLSS